MNWNSVIIGAIIASLVGIPFSIFSNIATPWVKSYFEKGSLSIRERRIYILATRYQYIMKLKESRTKILLLLVIWTLASAIFLVLSIATFILLYDLSTNFAGVLLGTFGVFYSIILLVSLVIASFLWWSLVKDMFEATNFENYREKTIKKIIKLGGNPEDLDKEGEG